MENHHTEKEGRDDPNPSPSGPNMDNNSWQRSYIDDRISKNEKPEEEEHSDGPDGDKDNTAIAPEKETANDEPKQDRITAIRPYKGNGHL